jgi:hypothetical protein
MARAPGAGTPGLRLVSDQREAISYGPHGRALSSFRATQSLRRIQDEGGCFPNESADHPRSRPEILGQREEEGRFAAWSITAACPRFGSGTPFVTTPSALVADRNVADDRR